MTFSGWFVFIMLAMMIALAGYFAMMLCNSTAGKCATIAIAIFLILAMLFGMLWFYKNTASGQRALTDQKSNMNNGLERTVKIYTANGDTIATYSGKIDIDTNDGGYVKFDFDGKRYIYYNCFVESIAEIN